MTVLYVFAILFFAIPLLDYLYCRNIFVNGIKVDAVVLRTDKIESDGDFLGHSYFPVFRYIVAGKEYETRYSTGNMGVKYADGAAVQIYCHRENPKKVMLLHDKTRNAIRILFIALGAADLCAAAAVSSAA